MAVQFTKEQLERATAAMLAQLDKPNPLLQAIYENRDNFTVPKGPRCVQCKSKETQLIESTMPFKMYGGSLPFKQGDTYGCNSCKCWWTKLKKHELF